MRDDALTAAVMQFDPAAYTVAQQRARHAPLDLIEEDFAMLAIVAPSLAADARERLRLAQLALVAKASPAPAVPAADPPRPDETLADLAARTPDRPTPILAFSALVTFCQEKNAKDTERNRRLDVLEARVLELEAQRAATAAEVEG